MTQYIYDEKGFLNGVADTDTIIPNSTTIPPIYLEGKTPQFINGAWVDNTILPMLSPIEFKMLFRSQERIAIKASTNAVVQDFFEIINDPRLTYVDRNLQSVKDAVGYLESEALIGMGRAAEILS